MITYPLNNIDYTAEDAEIYFCTRQSGVYDADSFPVSVSGADNIVTIGKGIAWIKNTEFSGKSAVQKESIDLELELPDNVNKRIDAIVIQFNSAENSTEIIVKNGTASSSPTPPEVVRSANVYELHLYHILREAGTSVVSAQNITDLRNDYDYCGVMIDPVTAIDSTLKKYGYAADAGAVGVALANSGGPELIWTNESEDEEFAAQTLDFSFAENELVLIACENQKGEGLEQWFHVRYGKSVYLQLVTEKSLYQRTATISADGVTITDCTRRQLTESGSGTVANGYAVPSAIYKLNAKI